MFSAFTTVVQTLDKFGDLKKSLEELSKRDVLVGIPEEKASREGTDEINNAELAYLQTHGVRSSEMIRDMAPDISSNEPYSKAYKMYIQSHGSPLWHSPPRPIIEPAIENSKARIAEELRAAVMDALEGRNPENKLKRAGMIAQNVVRAWFVDPANGWAPNSPLTIAKKGSSRPLIDTGELRKSITYVIREKG